MALLDWLRGKLSPRHRASWLYRRGLLKAKAGDLSSAIEVYGQVIETSEADANVRAMARYNRALLLWSSGDAVQALKDLNRLVEDAGAPEQVKTEARRKLLRISRTTERADESDGHA